jgi:hypothetical protein
MSANEDGTSSADEYSREAVKRIQKRLKNKKINTDTVSG